MKIAIDGFNLGFQQGTGLATYARELSTLLQQNGHEIYPIYGLNQIEHAPDLAFSSFIQSLMLRGEASRGEFLRWGTHFLKRSGKHLARVALQAKEIPYSDNAQYKDMAQKLPAFDQLFNIPSVYRVSQANSIFLSKKPTLISLPPNGVKADILHLTCPLPISMRGAAKVVTLHDVIPLTLPHSTKLNLRHYQRMMSVSLRDAQVILSVSEHSKKDLLNYIDIPEEKVVVTHQAVNIPQKYRTLTDEQVSLFLEKKFSLPFKKYFLFYGAIEPKKNVARILEAFNYAKTDFPIVIVGKNGWLFDDVTHIFDNQSPRQAQQFKRIPYASFDSLMHLLKGARGLVFPSLYEGFGLPILEAMQLGCPVITSNVSSMPEIGGDAAHYIDPTDTHSLADAIDLFSTDTDYINSLTEKGYAQAELFSPENHYLKVKEAYSRIG